MACPPLIDTNRATRQNLFNLGEFPLLVAQGAGRARLEPSLDAVEVKDVTTATPGNAQTRVLRVTIGVGLVFNAWLIQVVSADGAGVCADGPRPHCHRIPLFDLEALAPLFLAGSCCLHIHRCGAVVTHLLRCFCVCIGTFDVCTVLGQCMLVCR